MLKKSVYVLRSVKVFDGNDFCHNTTFGSACWVIDGIDWILGEHYPSDRAVANMSFGMKDEPPDPIGSWEPTTYIDDAVEDMIDAGIVVVVASGNVIPNDMTNVFKAEHISPARVGPAITVASSHVYQGDDLWVEDLWDEDPYFLSTGHTYSSSCGEAVDLMAPGFDITTASSSSNSASIQFAGTSAAAPHVAGAAAMVLEWQELYSPAQVKGHLVDIAREDKIIFNSNWDCETWNTPNRLLFINQWFYPYHTFAEWENSDAPVENPHWVDRPALGLMWTNSTNYPWFQRDSDGHWLYLIQPVGTTLDFWNDTTEEPESYSYSWSNCFLNDPATMFPSNHEYLRPHIL